MRIGYIGTMLKDVRDRGRNAEVLTVRLDREAAAALRRVAAEQGQSLNALLAPVLRRLADEHRPRGRAGWRMRR